MKKLSLLTLGMAMALTLVSCGSNTTGNSTEPNTTTTPATSETTAATTASSEQSSAVETEVKDKADTSDKSDADFTEKSITVITDKLDSTETATVRFYEDLPSVPYMSVTDFYNTFYLVNTDLSEGMTSKQEGNKYTVTNFCDDTAVFDAEADTIVIDNMVNFIKLACDLKSANIEGLDPDYPYAKISHVLDPEKAVPINLDLSDYNIDIKGDDTGVYLPLPTLSDIFASASGYYVVYVGEKIYVRDLVGLYFGSVMTQDPDYFTAVKADRPEDLAQYTYDELCFNMDLWNGKPGQEFIHEDLMNGSLDEVLSGKYPEVKKMLLAGDFENFYSGLMHLFNGLLFDGGHAGMGCDDLIDEEIDLSTKIMKDVRAKDYAISYNETGKRMQNMMLREDIREPLYNGDNYAELGDTAIINLDQNFTVDVDAWQAFYAGKGELPDEIDTVSIVQAGLERAARNPEIKNIIFDDSCNVGGNDIAMLAVEWLATGNGYVRDKNMITDQFNTKSEIFDINHDGKIDDSDVSPYTEYRYGVLTSDGSFSCGNAFPWFMHEHGVLILGEKSSGGACGIRMSSVGGIEVRNSAASSSTVTKDGDTVDNGCPVDIDLISEGENPYENFYDLSILSEQMNKHYDGV